MRKKKEFVAERQPKAVEPTYELAPGRSNLQLAESIRTNIRDAKTYARWRRKQWSVRATVTQVLMFALSAGSTVTLGLAERDLFSSIGFVFSALVTAGSAIEPYFNWRSRWVLAEEALASWHEIEDALCTYVASNEVEALDRETILEFDRRRASTWERFSEKWLSRRTAHKG